MKDSLPSRLQWPVISHNRERTASNRADVNTDYPEKLTGEREREDRERERERERERKIVNDGENALARAQRE